MNLIIGSTVSLQRLKFIIEGEDEFQRKFYSDKIRN